ncbi:DUF3696 domain-containing protein [Pseudomonas luteola]
MKSMLYFHCGKFEAMPKDIEILGSLTATNAHMTRIGRGLRVPNEGDVRHVFSNDNALFEGLRLAIATHELSHEQVNILFHGDQGELEIEFTSEGNPKSWPDGLFDQSEKNLMELLTIEGRGPQPE